MAHQVRSDSSRTINPQDASFIEALRLESCQRDADVIEIC
jgi:hypothetical protein